MTHLDHALTHPSQSLTIWLLSVFSKEQDASYIEWRQALLSGHTLIMGKDRHNVTTSSFVLSRYLSKASVEVQERYLKSEAGTWNMMRLGRPPRPERSSSRRHASSRSSAPRSIRSKSRADRYGDDSSIISSSTPLPITPSAGMVFDANGNDIGQALALKVSLSEVRIKEKARKAKEKRTKKERVVKSSESWISKLGNLTSDFSLDRTDSWASKNTQGSKRGRVVKETLIRDPTKSALQHAHSRKTNSYMPSKYMSHESAKNTEDGWLGGLFGTFVCDGRQDEEDTESSFTAHRDDRGVFIYEV